MNEILWTILGLGLPFIATCVGASFVLFLKNDNQKFQSIALSVSAGIMIAGAFFSLIIPAIEMSQQQNIIPIIPVGGGIILGLLFLLFAEIFILNKYAIKNKNFLLVSAITLHNIPEGMIVGLAFGMFLLNPTPATLSSALSLSIAISIQNIPEGSSVSMPLYAKGTKKKKAFFVGMLSGLVEPIGAILSILIVGVINTILPFLLCFSAGCMLYVVVKELVPESQSQNKTLETIFFFVGFLVMLILDIL